MSMDKMPTQDHATKALMAPNLSMVAPMMGLSAMSNMSATEIMNAPTVGANPTLSAYMGK